MKILVGNIVKTLVNIVVKTLVTDLDGNFVGQTLLGSFVRHISMLLLFLIILSLVNFYFDQLKLSIILILLRIVFWFLAGRPLVVFNAI